MKTSTKVWLAIAAALVLLGGAVFVGAMTLAKWDFGSLGAEKFETNTTVISEGFRDITIQGATEDITFLPAEDGACRVVFHETEKQKHFAKVQAGTLEIGVIDSRDWQDHLFSTGAPTITVYLPERAYGKLTIVEDTGDASISKEFSFETIDIEVSTGDVECHASVTGTIGIRTSTGGIRLEGASADAVSLKASTGKVEVAHVTWRGAFDLTVSTGKAVLTEVTCARFMTKGNTGSITCTDVMVDGVMAIERTTGDVTFELCDAGELQVQTDTGDVTGSLRSAKVFIVQSDTGKIDVPESVTGGKCKITSDTGDIRIRIE